VKKRLSAATLWLMMGLAIAMNVQADAQSHRVGAGLSFGSVLNYNTGETGNPGFSVHYWLGLNKPGTLHLVPSVTFYNPYKLKTGYMVLSNYLIQCDLNLQYTFFHQGSVKMVTFGGGNFTQLVSDFTPIVITGDETLEDCNDRTFGGNLGAGLELYMSPKWDFNVSGKYILSNYSQFVISVQAAYYFKKRRMAYRR
jgi:hypothetical protein